MQVDDKQKKKRTKKAEGTFTFSHVGAKRYAFNLTYDVVNERCVVTGIIPIVNQAMYPLKQAIDNIGEAQLKQKAMFELKKFTGLSVEDFSPTSFVISK